MKKILLLLCTLFAASIALAADPKPADSGDDIDAKLAAARAKLEAAAHEVAELSARAGKSAMDRFYVFHGDAPRHAIIGVQLDPASGKDGARVQEVSPGGPAAEAGVQSGDTIVRVNGADIKGDSAREVVRLMGAVEPDSKVNLRVMRGGKSRDIVVVARPIVGLFGPGMPPPPPMGFGHDFDTPMSYSHVLGGEFADMELATLTPQLGRYFGASEGVLVVRKGDGDALKLEDGDVIVSIDGRKPASGSHATRILRSYQPGEKINIHILRDRKTVNLEATLPEERGRHRMRTFHTGPDETES